MGFTAPTELTSAASRKACGPKFCPERLELEPDGRAEFLSLARHTENGVPLLFCLSSPALRLHSDLKVQRGKSQTILVLGIDVSDRSVGLLQLCLAQFNNRA